MAGQQFEGISLGEEKEYSNVLFQSPFDGISLGEEKVYDLNKVRNKAVFGGISFIGAFMTPDIQINIIT